MKYTFLFLAVIFSFSSFAQNEDTVFQPNNGLKNIPFVIVEKAPIYFGCEVYENNDKIIKCMSSSLMNHVSRNFNTSFAKELGLPNGITKIKVNFIVTKRGKVEHIKIAADHPRLEEEAERVMKLIPKFTKPGYHKGKAVNVPYFLPINFEIVN